jgi:hypothetical protein
MRALRGCISPAENTATVHLHIQEAELTHVEILSILINISQRWKLFYSHVDDLMSALSDQLCKLSIQQLLLQVLTTNSL